MDILFLKNKNIELEEVNIFGDGWLEENCVVDGTLNGRFHIGAYSIISRNSLCLNAFIGRFSTIEEGVQIGYPNRKIGNLSNHAFSHDINIPNADEYYENIISRYFYEQNKYTFIGSDVLIGRNSTIVEGCKIGDGAIIHPNSFVNKNIPPYAIASGSPANVTAFRFPEVIINKLVNIKWWMKDISSIKSHELINLNDYVDNYPLIEILLSNEFPLLKKEKIYINTYRNITKTNTSNNLIVGPSHISLWFSKYNDGLVSIPLGSHLIPIPAMSLFSDQLLNLIEWWKEWFDDVILFVPDFRIGNVAVDRNIKDGRFIRPDILNDSNSEKCYKLGLKTLDKLSSEGKVRFWFWCLYGREHLNKESGQYFDEKGNYSHPLWNYNEIKERYHMNTIDINEYFTGIQEWIIDNGIHPSNECYEKFSSIFGCCE